MNSDQTIVVLLKMMMVCVIGMILVASCHKSQAEQCGAMCGLKSVVRFEGPTDSEPMTCECAP